MIIWLASCLAFITLWQNAGEARNTRMMQLAWLTQNGNLLDDSNQDIFSSQFLVPLAVEHFNSRYGEIVPALKELGSCSAKIDFQRMRDNGGLSSIAMLDLVGDFRFRDVDIIQGPVKSDVRFVGPVI